MCVTLIPLSSFDESGIFPAESGDADRTLPGFGGGRGGDGVDRVGTDDGGGAKELNRDPSDGMANSLSTR